ELIFGPSACPSDGIASQLHRSRLTTIRPGASGEMLAKLCALPSLNHAYRYSTLSPSGSTAGSTTVHVSGWPATGGEGITASRPPLGGMLPMVRCALAAGESACPSDATTEHVHVSPRAVSLAGTTAGFSSPFTACPLRVHA